MLAQFEWLHWQPLDRGFLLSENHGDAMFWLDLWRSARPEDPDLWFRRVPELRKRYRFTTEFIALQPKSPHREFSMWRLVFGFKADWNRS